MDGFDGLGEYQQEVMCKCRTCGIPITRHYYVGHPYCDKCRSEYRKQKEMERNNKLPYPDEQYVPKCPNLVESRYFSHVTYGCSKHGKGRIHCSTVRQIGKCPLLKISEENK